MDVDYELKTLKDNLYDYFKRTYGKLTTQTTIIISPSSEEKSPKIRYISKPIRCKYKKNRLKPSTTMKKFVKMFEAIVKNTSEKDDVIKHNFDKASWKRPLVHQF